MHPNDGHPPALAIEGHLARITLQRPARRNSLTDEDLHTLLAHFSTVNANPEVRVLVFSADTRGQPRPVFSAGYNVGGFESGAHDPGLFQRVPDALEALRPITVCALNGSVYGGATDFVLACDLRFALAGSEFRMPAAALGLHYYPGGLRRYVTRLGLNTAKRAFLLGRALSVEQLQASSALFEAISEPLDFDADVSACTAHLLTMAPLASQLTKQSLNELATAHWDEAALRARETTTSESEDFAEGRRAFAERRAPRFLGR